MVMSPCRVERTALVVMRRLRRLGGRSVQISKVAGEEQGVLAVVLVIRASPARLHESEAAVQGDGRQVPGPHLEMQGAIAPFPRPFEQALQQRRADAGPAG